MGLQTFQPRAQILAQSIYRLHNIPIIAPKGLAFVVINNGLTRMQHRQETTLAIQTARTRSRRVFPSRPVRAPIAGDL